MTDVLERIAGLDQFYVQQKFSLMVNKYKVSSVDPGGNEGEPLLYVAQKRMKIREEINLFVDEEQKQPALQIKARNVFEFRGRSEVKLADGTVIGQLQKVFGKSLFRSTWQLLDADGNTVAMAQEKSVTVAIFRRFGDMIPYVGFISDLVPFHFDIIIGAQKVGEYTRQMSVRDRYVMDLTGDAERRVDRRVAVAFAIALDALQDR